MKVDTCGVVNQSTKIRQESEGSVDDEEVSSSSSGVASSDADDGQAEYTDNAESLAPAGYANIPRADRDVVFASKLLRMLDSVEEDGFEHIIGWQPHGRCFVVRDHKRILDILIKYLKISKWATFHRQLYVYGFKRITQGPDKGAYYHEKCLRGRPFLAAQMNRVPTRGLRGRKKVTKEPDFWSMPWVKPLESKSPSPKSNKGAEAHFPGARSHPMATARTVVNTRHRPPHIPQDVTRIRDDRVLLTQDGAARSYASFQSPRQLVYVKEADGEMIRMEDPLYSRVLPSERSSMQRHLLHSESRRLPPTTSAPAVQGGSRWATVERMPLQVAMVPAPPPSTLPVYPKIINATPVLVTEQPAYMDHLGPMHHSAASLYSVHGRASHVLHNSHLSMSSVPRTPLVHHEAKPSQWYETGAPHYSSPRLVPPSPAVAVSPSERSGSSSTVRATSPGSQESTAFRSPPPTWTRASSNVSIKRASPPLNPAGKPTESTVASREPSPPLSATVKLTQRSVVDPVSPGTPPSSATVTMAKSSGNRIASPVAAVPETTASKTCSAEHQVAEGLLMLCSK